MKIFNFSQKRKTGTDSEDSPAPWLIAGLGNPGPNYERTWHNAGFMCLDALSQKHGIPVNKIKFKGLYGQGTLAGQKVILLKPATFMNNSGESIIEAAAFFRIPPSRTILIYDDVDIECGNIRIRPGGSGGTHNGMRSVITHMNTTDFPRIRIGIGPLPENRDIVNYVLSEVPALCRTNMSGSIGNAAAAVSEILANGLEAGMQKYNTARSAGKKSEAGPADA
ncbi:MAG: aminoacyl-tRNA hydrolase [Saccharofermentanales bacterium]